MFFLIVGGLALGLVPRTLYRFTNPKAVTRPNYSWISRIKV